MKKISLMKIIVALVICNVYVFTCGVMGVIREKPPVSTGESVPQSTSPVTPLPGADGEDVDQAQGQGTIDFFVPADSLPNSGRVELELMNFQTPSMADRVIYTTVGELDDSVPEDIGTMDVIFPEDVDEETVEELVIPEDDEPEETTTTSTTRASSLRLTRCSVLRCLLLQLSSRMPEVRASRSLLRQTTGMTATILQTGRQTLQRDGRACASRVMTGNGDLTARAYGPSKWTAAR